ncbi:GNAT family N-acetyltransferase [Lacibacter sp. MH-610]|uniref:GNAT family N-acetyltransferase n=1 Tax=Lacibacter sp. MH-610 TaxID=3020883 RepID=UPI0038926CFB
MQAALSNGKIITVRTFQLQDCTALSRYLNQLSDATKQRFAPHDFDEQSIEQLYQNPSSYIGFLALDNNETIIAYAVVKIGHLSYEVDRLAAYGLQPHPLTDAVLAPSVADAWQGSGIGSAMMQHIKEQLLKFGIQRIFLWGGVQATNVQAINFYGKHQFTQLGVFEYKGSNIDMVCCLT